MTLREKFEVFDNDNPHIYEMFAGFTIEAINAGKTKLSAWLITNRIRWETEVVTKSEDKYKISNDYIALYARKFIAENPQYKNFFNIKEMKRI
jgi:hypothetical protein